MSEQIHRGRVVRGRVVGRGRAVSGRFGVVRLGLSEKPNLSSSIMNQTKAYKVNGDELSGDELSRRRVATSCNRGRVVTLE